MTVKVNKNYAELQLPLLHKNPEDRRWGNQA